MKTTNHSENIKLQKVLYLQACLGTCTINSFYLDSTDKNMKQINITLCLNPRILSSYSK